MIDCADIYIGIYGARYGWKIESGVSVTEFEFNEFRRRHPDRILIYIQEIKVVPEQEAFLKRVQDFKEGYFRRPKFTSAEQLAGWVKEDLVQFIARIVHDKMDGRPASVVIRAYLEQVTAQKPYVLWSDETYIDRTVAKTEDLFARTVARYDPLVPKHLEQANPEPLGEVLAREKKLVLLGEPGLGKTTTLLHLAWDTANHAVIPSPDSKIPIYVELKNYNGEVELEILLAHRINEVLTRSGLMLAPDLNSSAQILKAWLVQPDTRFLLLFDGLNEVRPEFYASVREALKSVLKYSHEVVTSCREHDYDASLRDNAKAVVLQPLHKSEIQKYLQNSFGKDGTKLFDEQIQGDWKMSTLAANPLMLWLIGFVAISSPNSRLPRNRGKLFREFVNRMPLRRVSEGMLGSQPAVVIFALSKLGFEMQERGMLEADCDDLLEWDIPTANKPLEDVLAQAKDWRFLKSDGRLGERIEFLHQLFLEYFAAEYLRRRLEKQYDYQQVLA